MKDIKEEPEPELPAGFVSCKQIQVEQIQVPYSIEVVNGVVSLTVEPGNEHECYDFKVPLAGYSDTMKQVKAVQQKHTTLIVEVDNSCLYAMDTWKIVGSPQLGGGMPVGSTQLEGHVCPHCGKSSF